MVMIAQLCKYTKKSLTSLFSMGELFATQITFQ